MYQQLSQKDIQNKNQNQSLEVSKYMNSALIMCNKLDLRG